MRLLVWWHHWRARRELVRSIEKWLDEQDPPDSVRK